MRRSVGQPRCRAAVLPCVILLAACADASRIASPGRVKEPGLLPSKQGPTGGRILYAAGSPKTDLFSMDADGSDVLRLTTAGSNESTPAWAPDGKRVLYGSDADAIAPGSLPCPAHGQIHEGHHAMHRAHDDA